MINEGGANYGQGGREKLIVRWRTAGGPTNLAAGTARIAQLLGRSPSSKDKPPPSPFHGLFIFTFDEVGRILTHTIEHSEESRDAENVTSKVFNLTDWLIKKARGQEEREPELAWSRRDVAVLQSSFSKSKASSSGSKGPQKSESKLPDVNPSKFQARGSPSKSRAEDSPGPNIQKPYDEINSSSKNPSRPSKLSTLASRLMLQGADWGVEKVDAMIEDLEEIQGRGTQRKFREHLKALKWARRGLRETLVLELR